MVAVIKKYKYIITLILIVLITLITTIGKYILNKQKYNLSIEDEIKISETNELLKKEENDVIKMCTVDIKGAINKPGIYTTECSKHIHDIIVLAEGLTENANTSTINLAKKINDEMVIIIYTNEEINDSKNSINIEKTVDNECICPTINNDAYVTNNRSSNNLLKELININKATIDELKRLPGIGDAKAKAIIKYRENSGYFKNIEEIKNVNGIGEKLYAEIAAFITA